MLNDLGEQKIFAAAENTLKEVLGKPVQGEHFTDKEGTCFK